MTWDEMHDLAKRAYLEGVKDAAEGAVFDDETLQFMWECSDACRDLPESTMAHPAPEREEVT
jgi:hypothetical protein